MTVLVVATGLLPHVDHVLHILGVLCFFEQGVSRNQSRCPGFRAGDGQRMGRHQLLHLIGGDGGLGLDILMDRNEYCHGGLVPGRHARHLPLRLSRLISGKHNRFVLYGRMPMTKPASI